MRVFTCAAISFHLPLPYIRIACRKSRCSSVVHERLKRDFCGAMATRRIADCDERADARLPVVDAPASAVDDVTAGAPLIAEGSFGVVVKGVSVSAPGRRCVDVDAKAVRGRFAVSFFSSEGVGRVADSFTSCFVDVWNGQVPIRPQRRPR